MRMDIRSYADQIETNCGHILKPAPIGIYRNDQLDPAIVGGKTYYFKEGPVMCEVAELDSLKKAIYDEKGELVIPYLLMQNKGKCLSNEPILPYRGSYVVKTLVDNLIGAFAHQTRRSYSASTAEAHLKKHFNSHESLDEDAINTLKDCCSNLLLDVEAFIEGHEWNIFFISLKGTIMRIDRCMDWRAWEWETRHGDDFRSGKYRGA